jgi:hypothetical protein
MHAGCALQLDLLRRNYPPAMGIVGGAGVLEGINNEIKITERVAYGFRDMAYSFLKVRAQFSAVPHQTRRNPLLLSALLTRPLFVLQF